MKYKINWRYKDDRIEYQEGAIVELTDVEASQLNRDSPGIATEVGAEPPATKKAPRPKKR